MFIRITYSYSFQHEMYEIKKALRERKDDSNQFIHMGKIVPDQKSEDKITRNFADLGEFYSKKGTLNYSIDKLKEDYLTIGDKPFWYMGKRYTLPQMKAIMMLRS